MSSSNGIRRPAFHTEIRGSIPRSDSFSFFISTFSKKKPMFEALSSLSLKSILKIGPSSNESLKYRDIAIVKFESGPCCPHLEKCISFYFVAYYSQISLQFEIPHFLTLSWPLETIKIFQSSN